MVIYHLFCSEKPVAKYLQCTSVLLLYTACLPMGSLLLLLLIPSATLTLRTRVRILLGHKHMHAKKKTPTHSSPKYHERTGARRRRGRSRCLCFRPIGWREITHRTEYLPTIGCCCDSTTHTYLRQVTTTATTCSDVVTADKKTLNQIPSLESRGSRKEKISKHTRAPSDRPIERLVLQINANVSADQQQSL